MILLSKKKQEIFIILLKNDNKALSFNEIFSELTKQNIRISKRTVKNTLDDYNQFNKHGNPYLITKELDKTTGRTCFKINDDIETFIELARNLLNNKDFNSIFFRSKYTQQILKNIDIMKRIEKNLNLEFDRYTHKNIHQIINNSPSALYFGLFASDLKSQKTINANTLSEEAEHEIRENFISRLLDDLRDKDFFLSEDLEKLQITIKTNWKFKGKKRLDADLELTYKQ
ncbi:MAG: hypothetical protein ACQXXF_08000 [Thermoplasmatota archaeon]|jgi:hypothetical protein